MVDPRILLLQCPSDHEEELPESLRHHFPEIAADIAQYETQALVKLEGCQAVICWAEGRDELAAVIRIPKADPKVPIFVVSSRNSDKEFRSLALKVGATLVQPDPQDTKILAGAIAAALRATSLAQQTKDHVQRARDLTQDMCDIAEKTRQLTQTAKEHLKTGSLGRFNPLIVLGEKNGIELFKKALNRAKLSCPLPIFRRGGDAISYLDGRPPYGDRKRHPLPSIVILNSGSSSLEVLSWMRNEPRFRAMPAAFLSRDGLEVAKAASLGATWCLPKGTTAADLAETLKKISLNWTIYNIGLEV